MSTTAHPPAKANLAELYAEYVAGSPIIELAKKHKIHPTAIYAGFALAQYPVNLPQSDSRRKISLEDEAYLIDLYEQGKTLLELAEEFKLSHQGIAKIIMRNGVKVRRTWATKPYYKKKMASDID
jgi:Mor family transcriptional regulator